MNKLTFLALATAAASVAAQNAYPLPASAAPGSTNAFENTAPFLAPFRMSQELVVNRTTLNLQGLPATFGLWDMSAFDPTGRYIFTPSEVPTACGVFRFDQQTGALAVLMTGNGVARTADPNVWVPTNDDYSRFDPCTYTPWNTILVGEETTGGRLFEVMNPLSNGPFTVRWLTKVPALSHEGVRFDRFGNMYVVDEDNSGCIYKFVPTVAGDLSNGQTFVLSVDAYAADLVNGQPAQAWNSTANRLATRFGAAHWVPMTDVNGVALTVTNPFVYVTANSGRLAADEVRGTPYGRPEDMDINVLASGNDCLYVTTTSENRVISIELTGATTATVRAFCDFNTINRATGADVNPLQNDPYTAPGAGTVFASPDNLAVDAYGSVYVIEDGEPNGGDIWKCHDANKDGVAESLGLFLSLGISGSEPSGMIFDPSNPDRFIVNIQHPASGNDATWAFETRPYPGSRLDLVLRTGVNVAPTEGPGELVKDILGFDTAIINVSSPNGALDNAPYAVLLQGFTTAVGQPSFLPTLWMDLFGLDILPLIGGPVGQFTTVLPIGGSTTAILVPPGLAGFSVMVQSIAVSPSNTLVLTDGHEFALR